MQRKKKTSKSEGSAKAKKQVDENSWREPLEAISINDDEWWCIVTVMVETITEHFRLAGGSLRMQRKKKASKSEGSAKAKKQVDENSWREPLEAISINDDEWWCIVTVMVETITEHSRLAGSSLRMQRKKKASKSEGSAKAKKQVDEDSWREPLEAISINDDEWWCIVTVMVETITEHSRLAGSSLRMQRKKKASKSEGSAKAKKQVDEDSWREPLEAISINDDEWWCIVTVMVETITEHSRLVGGSLRMQRKKKASKSEGSAKAKKQVDENSWREPLEAISINDDEWWCIVTVMVETITEHSRLAGSSLRMQRKKKASKSEGSAKAKKQVDEDSWREPLEAISINDDEWWCIVTVMVETITEHSRLVGGSLRMQRKKKASKSEGSAKAKKQVDENSWREPLEAISINDDEWWCIVTVMVETITEHSRCVSLFNVAAEEGRRKAIYTLSCQKTLASVRALSKQSLDKCPTIQGVCHYANKVLNENNDALPSWLMARIIKYLIYRAREESIRILKRLADLEREIDEEYLIMQTVADWGQPGSKKFDEEIFNRKANTKLRKRGEEWREAVYVDDAPLNGPNLYIILTGFHEPDLLEHLINIGVPLSCLMQIKRPNERLNRDVQYETVAEKRKENRKFHFLEEYTVDKMKLFDFWTRVKKRMMDPEAYPEYCDIGLLVFCPPQLPGTSNKREYEALKKDMYDRVSYIVYDFYDVYRQHGNYLKSMKVEKGIFGESAEKASMQVYETLLDKFPSECVSVPLILFAILMQVEANVKRVTAKNSIDEKGDARATAMDGGDLKPEAEITSLSPVAFVEQKAKTLNIEYDLDDEEHSSDHNGQNVTDIELILHEDSLCEAICLMDDSAIPLVPKPTDLIDNVLSIFRHPIVASIRKKHDIGGEKLNEYTRHIDNVRRYFDVEISAEEVMHHLHILIFDGMLHRSPKVKPEALVITMNEVMRNARSIKDLTFPTKRSKSLPSLTSESTPKVYFLSDGNFDYGKVVPEVVECSSLFDLIDPRELLVPGYLEKNVWKTRATDRPRLEDFSDIELLSKPIFLQLLHECLLAFDRVELRYFEPTDSLLLYFRNKWEINGVSKEERMSSIRTPVRLRDFCKYVVPEEKDWLRRKEEQYRLQTAESMERLMRKNAEIYDETMLFRDEDFILPGTLKAKDLEARRDLDRQKSSLEVAESSHSLVADVTKSIKKGKAKGKEYSKKEVKRSDKSTGRKTDTKQSIAVEGSPSTMEKLSQVKSDEMEATYDFIGYDLGRLRVQVTNRKKTFYSADDTLVQVETDDWLYKSKHLQITVTLRGYSLRLFHRIDKPETIEIFHLTSRRGIILAFQKLQNSSHPSKNDAHTWQDMNVESRISWPTGLLIKSVIGDGPENPYYIRQLYAPKGHMNSNENREICRKFLRNGTVLKYLSDDSIIVLRPNGVIVNCTAFKKTQTKQHESHDDQTSGSKSGHVNASGDKPKETKLPPKTRRKPMSNLKSQLREAVEGDSLPAQQNLTTGSDNVLSMMDSTVKVSRYTVLNHDGRQYEVHDDLVVSEQHRLLVRMASDYEVDEKFTRRADGTNMLLNSNGELIVRFPDGTRITTGYAIEKEPVTCDWTEEEILRYFVSEEMKENEQNSVEPPFSNHGYTERPPFPKSTMDFEEKITELSITDSFVSVLLTCRMEHKNYATVSYDQSAVNCTLSMPDDLRVSISRRGDYEVSMADGVNLKINEDNLSFQGNSCTVCGSQSTSTYNFFPSTVLFTTVDVFGNILEVKDDGETNYHPNAEISKRGRRNSNLDAEQREYCECYEEFEDIGGPSCTHEALRLTNNVLGCRMFSINRDFTAYEYIHRLARNRIELVAVFDDDTSVILYPSSHRPMLRRLITLEPVAAKSRLKNALSFPDFKLKPTNFDRRDVLRSTYSIPYDWLFPFGRNGNGIWKNTHDLPLMDDVEALPELLRIRILRGFKEPGGNAVIDLQRALGRYWMSLVGDIFPSHFVVDQERETRRNTSEAVYGHLEDNLRALSLGIKKTIDVETYKIGLEKQWTISETTARRRSMNFDEFLGQKDTEKEELEWYKRCAREKFILPYFRNITGTCFLWIMDCIENATSASESSDEIGESSKFLFL